MNQLAEPRVCPACGGKLRKNGVYQVLNWVRLLLPGLAGRAASDNPMLAL